MQAKSIKGPIPVLQTEEKSRRAEGEELDDHDHEHIFILKK